jgi:hypothetical protein
MTTVGAAKDWIPGFKNNPAPDATLQKLVTGVSRDVVRMLGARVDWTKGSPTFGMSSLNAQIQITQRLDGNGSNVLFLDARPCLSIVSLQINGYTPPINVVYGQPGVYIEKDAYSIAFATSGFGSGSVQTVGWPSCGSSGTFPMGRGNILITYLAGYGIPVPDSDPQEYTTPDDLEVAVDQIIALNYTRRDRVGLDSENIQNSASTSYAKYDYPPEALAVLRKYVRVPLGAQS